LRIYNMDDMTTAFVVTSGKANTMRILIAVIFLSGSLPCFAQDHTAFNQSIRELYRAGTKENADKHWNQLISTSIPFVYKDSVIFLYKGEARSVSWMGDFNNWGYDKSFMNSGSRIPNTDIWILRSSFPNDARLDYKIVIDEKNWILDPVNVNQQWSGVGGGSPNSELRMPEWRADPVSIYSNSVAHGSWDKDVLFNSRKLGYQITYSVYLPVGYDASVRYPIIYVLDGYEYMHDRMGNMITILDNLIGLNKIKPVIAIFVDHREPVNRSNNRRMKELAMNALYLSFFTEELIPVIETQYSVSDDRTQRAILGTSMGGLTAAYFSFSKPEIFGLAGIQSPAFWFKPDIYTFCDNPEKPPVKIFMTTGVINDAREGAQKMRAILEKNTCIYAYKEINQGHSWGNWRDLIDDILIYFYPGSN
jgi:enterochelin esterase family protein